jgi:small subunit ribosomal protein S11
MAVPSPCRSCQQRLSFSQVARTFSSVRQLNAPPPSSRDKGREIERQILETGKKESSDELSPLSAITRMMQGEKSRTTPSITRDYSRIAESLEAEMIRHPYADRAPPHHLHIYAHKHNTLITLTRPNGNPLLSLGCGNLGFRKSQRSGYDPAYQLASHVFAQIQEKGILPDIQRLELVFRGFGAGRDAFTKVLLGNEGRNIRGLISRVTDSTRIKFGGTRSRKVRRLG